MVITLNEEKRLGRLLASLPKGVELVIVDGQSTDQTVDIAKSYGAHVVTRVFDDFSQQKNAALALCTRRWVLSVDADEELTAKLVEKIRQIVLAKDSSFAAYKLKRRLFFQGRALLFGKSSDQPLRLFQRGQGQFEKPIHERLALKAGMKVGLLSEGLWHYSYDNLTAYFQRFNKYTSLIAKDSYLKRKPLFWVLIQLVFRPYFEFLSRFIFRLGFLDGYPGYLYALLSSFYTFVKYAKLFELYQEEK